MSAVATPAAVIVEARQVVPVAEAAARIERHGEPVVLGRQECEDLDAHLPIPATV